MVKKSKNAGGLRGWWYVVGGLVLLAGVGAGTIYNLRRTPYRMLVDFARGKQQIADGLGTIGRVESEWAFWLWPWGTKVTTTLWLTGEKRAGRLIVTLTRDAGGWRMRDALLQTEADLWLSPVYVFDADFFAASATSAPLKEPVFAAGEDIHVRLTLRGLHGGAGGGLAESIRIFDEASRVVARAEDVTRLSFQDDADRGAFTNRIEALAPGRYFVQFVFVDGEGVEVEAFWQEIMVKMPPGGPLVKSIAYYNDTGRTQKNPDATFAAQQTVFLTMGLNGFLTTGGKVAGTVALAIKDERADVIAHLPKFAAFNHEFKPGHDVSVAGELKLKDPGVYFLHFTITDFFSKHVTTQVEKLIVTLPKN